MHNHIFFAILAYFVSYGTQAATEPDSKFSQDTGNKQIGSPIWKNSATSTMYNAAAGLPWKHEDGDWIDQEGIEQGNIPFATFQVINPGQVSTNITRLINAFISGDIDNNGILIKGSKGSAIADFYSIDSDNKSQWPTLLLTTSSGKKYTIVATADTYLDPTTRKSLSERTTLKLSSDRRTILIYFPLNIIPSDAQISKAELKLHMSKRYGSNSVIAEIYSVLPGGIKKNQLRQSGLAAGYIWDVGIENHPDVLLSEKFENFLWTSDWSETRGNLLLVDDNSLVTPLNGKALQITFKKGSRNAANITYKFGEKIGKEPESIYFRYYIWLSDNWNPIVGGKFPGIAGTYGKAGWGGRKADGFNGWSTRGAYQVPLKSRNSLHGLTPIGTYAYTADMPGNYGNYWSWPINKNGLLKKKRWYAIEQHVKLNTPGIKNGILRSWVDGKLAFEKTDILYRKSSDLKIDRILINFYHGGTTVIPTDQDLYIDNVVIAKKYIGPIRNE